jgi:SagB-type dehydrogenase family enzyme
MNKLAWVLAPLLLGALLAALLAWRGRLPGRTALNAWSSLLLLAYLGATAGLGIFWVANQHLPVFDWHYVFGYATLLLLALHLVLNFRALWAHLRRRPAAPPAGAGRRPVAGALGLAGLGLAVGGAYWLGLRHGRTELRVGADTGANAGLALIEAFHAHSSHSRAGVLRRAPAADWGGAPPPFKSLPDRPWQALPPAWHRAPLQPALHAQALATLLWHAAGVTAERGGLHLRAAPSSGALFATELYVAARGIGGVAEGLWHHDVPGGGLRRLAEGLPPAMAAALPAGAAGAIIATAVFRRSGHKYGDRTYRYVLADLGHLLENLRAAAAALGVPLRLARGFDESRLAEALGIDEREEGVLALVRLYEPGMGSLEDVDAADAASSARWRAVTVAREALGVTEAVHRATSLRAAGEGENLPSAVRAAAPFGPWPLLAAGPTLPRPLRAAYDPLPAIAARRSVRRYRAAPLPLATLSELLDAMTRPTALLSGAVRLHVVAHAVQGLVAGPWRYDSAGHALHASASHAPAERRRTRAAALDQDSAGDAAAVIVIAIDRGIVAADALGAARGYRHAFLEAGMLGERLYLQAGVLGLGVCAVGAFYDDEAAALIGVDPQREWVVHFATLGWPA